MNNFEKHWAPYFEGSIQPDEGIKIGHLLYRTTHSKDLDQLVALEQFWPEGLAMDPNDVGKDLELFPHLQIVAESNAGELVGKATIVRIDPGEQDSESIVAGEEGWYGLYTRRVKDGPCHEATGVVVQSHRQHDRIDFHLSTLLFRAVAEEVLRGGNFNHLTWSSSNHLFPRWIARQLGMRPKSDLAQITERFNGLSLDVQMDYHRDYIDSVLAGETKDVPFSTHAKILAASDGEIEIINKNVRCPEDRRSLGFGTRFKGTNLVRHLIDWQSQIRNQT